MFSGFVSSPQSFRGYLVASSGQGGRVWQCAREQGGGKVSGLQQQQQQQQVIGVSRGYGKMRRSEVNNFVVGHKSIGLVKGFLIFGTGIGQKGPWGFLRIKWRGS